MTDGLFLSNSVGELREFGILEEMKLVSFNLRPHYLILHFSM